VAPERGVAIVFVPPLFDAAHFLVGLAGLVRYSVTRRENIANSPMRTRILATLRQNPGIRFAALRRLIKCSVGTLQYHLRMLERDDLVSCIRTQSYRFLFCSDTPQAQRSDLALLGIERIRNVGRAILKQPGVSQRGLTDRLLICRKVLRGYLKRLSEEGFIQEIPRGTSRLYFPSDRLFEYLGTLDLNVTPPATPAKPDARLEKNLTAPPAILPPVNGRLADKAASTDDFPPK
jgi:predicted transcriptional regulator